MALKAKLQCGVFRSIGFHALFLIIACDRSLSPLQCRTSAQCDLALDGLCLMSASGSQWCQYHDNACPTGRRWSQDAGEGLSSQCVPPLFKRRITIVKNDDGVGLIKSNPPLLSCGNDCSADFDATTNVTLSAVAENGSRFYGWNWGDCAKQRDCLIPPGEENIVVNATFSPRGQIEWNSSFSEDPRILDPIPRSIVTDDKDVYVAIAEPFASPTTVFNIFGMNAHAIDGTAVIAGVNERNGQVRWISQSNAFPSSLFVQGDNVYVCGVLSIDNADAQVRQVGVVAFAKSSGVEAWRSSITFQDRRVPDVQCAISSQGIVLLARGYGSVLNPVPGGSSLAPMVLAGFGFNPGPPSWVREIDIVRQDQEVLVSGGNEFFLTEQSVDDETSFRRNAYVHIYDMQGSHKRTLSIGGSAKRRVHSVTPMLNGDYVLIGTTDSPSLSIFSQAILEPQVSAHDVFLIRLSSAFRVLWSRRFSGSVENTTLLLTEKEIIAVGSVQGTLDLNLFSISALGNRDVFVTYFDPMDGFPLWGFSCGSVDDDGSGLGTVNENGNMFVIGRFGRNSECRGHVFDEGQLLKLSP